MPLCWASKSVFRLKSSGESSKIFTIDTETPFTSFYKHEKGTDEDLLKILGDIRKPEKVSKLTLVPGLIKASLQQTTLAFVQDQVKASEEEAGDSPTIITEFPFKSIEPFRKFSHLLYVYPISLNLTPVANKIRARNILCRIFLRSEDDIDASRK